MNSNLLDRLNHISEEILNEKDSRKIRGYIGELIQHASVFNFEMRSIRPFFRARLCPENGFEYEHDMWAPPIGSNSIGRFNEEGLYILYLSSSVSSALDEIGAKDGDFIQVANYMLKENTALRCAVFGEVKSFFKWHRSSVSDDIQFFLEQKIKRMDVQEQKAYVMADSILSNICLCSSQKDEYLSSRELAKFVFETHPEINTLMYKGVDSDGARNFAVRTKAVANNMYLDNFCVLRVNKKYKYGIYDYEIVRTPHSQVNGKIVWNKKPD
jgi:hypothetical protein